MCIMLVTKFPGLCYEIFTILDCRKIDKLWKLWKNEGKYFCRCP